MQPKAGDPSDAGLVWPGFSLCYPQAYHQKKQSIRSAFMNATVDKNGIRPLMSPLPSHR